MPQDYFNQRKKAILNKKDKSSIGKWDEKIIKLCNKINSLDGYYTTSSCSGRVVLMIDKEKKDRKLFLKIYHKLVSFSQLKGDLTEIILKKELSNLNIKFKQEPCILHVACRNFDAALNILKKAQLAGWKKSGIISANKNHIVELNGTHKLEFPIISRGKILVSGEYLKLIIKKSNENLKKSWDKIEKLLEVI